MARRRDRQRELAFQEPSLTHPQRLAGARPGPPPSSAPLRRAASRSSPNRGKVGSRSGPEPVPVDNPLLRITTQVA